MQDLGIEFISVFGLPPVAFVELAAEPGCRHISLALQPIDYNPEGSPKQLQGLASRHCWNSCRAWAFPICRRRSPCCVAYMLPEPAGLAFFEGAPNADATRT